MSSFLQKSKEQSYDYNYPDGSGVSAVTEFETPGGKIRIWCTNWTEASGHIDHLGVAISPTEFLNWLYYDAR